MAALFVCVLKRIRPWLGFGIGFGFALGFKPGFSLGFLRRFGSSLGGGLSFCLELFDQGSAIVFLRWRCSRFLAVDIGLGGLSRSLRCSLFGSLGNRCI